MKTTAASATVRTAIARARSNTTWGLVTACASVSSNWPDSSSPATADAPQDTDAMVRSRKPISPKMVACVYPGPEAI